MAKRSLPKNFNQKELTRKVGRRAATLQKTSSAHINKHLKRRVKRASGEKRFVSGWLLLITLIVLATFVSMLQLRAANIVSAPISGGLYVEGMVGSNNSLNPLFGVGPVDDSVSRLLFNGLLRYDSDGKLVGDLADRWEVDQSRKVYTLHLRSDVSWHDGEPFTAQDVVHTIQAIQDPQARSVLRASWQGVDVEAKNKNQVMFTLPAPFTPFANALTTPILPHHMLKDVPASRLRNASFNTQPIGTGPFRFHAIRGGGSQIEVARYSEYHRSAPRLDRFTLRLFESQDDLMAAIDAREITAAVGVNNEYLDEFTNDTSIRTSSIPLNSGVFAFLKTNAPALSDTKVRQALAFSFDRQAVLDNFSYGYMPLRTPLLPSQLGYTDAYAQSTDTARAEKLLDEAGWKMGDDSVRMKGDDILAISLVTSEDSMEYQLMAHSLQEQWGAVGVKVDITLLNQEQLQQNALNNHTYDVLLYGISLGHDPDVYAYWHSSQAKLGGLNFSEWKSSLVDTSLDVGRTRAERVLRIARYKTFLEEWYKAAPAVALYQPRSSYVYHQNASGFISTPSNNAADRLTNVEKWTVNTKKVERTP